MQNVHYIKVIRYIYYIKKSVYNITKSINILLFNAAIRSGCARERADTIMSSHNRFVTVVLGSSKIRLVEYVYLSVCLTGCTYVHTYMYLFV